MTKKISFNTMHLKLIACFCMLLDHINNLLNSPIRQLTDFSISYIRFTYTQGGEQIGFSFDILYALGRIAFPIFCFQLAEGCKYTKNIKTYFFRLLIAGFISQPIFAWAHEQSITDDLNVIFTLAFGVLCIGIIKFISSKNIKDYVKYILYTLSVCLIYFVTLLFQMEYWQFGIPFILGLYLLDDRKKQAIWTFLFLFVLYFLYCGWTGFDFQWSERFTIFLDFVLTLVIASASIFFIKHYEYAKIKYNKYWFYIFYPAHLLVLCIIRQILNSFI
ncbi:MAG TPA: conjugal transfer protein TraX [Candidatus Butyricicoccus avistercoris]|uniref:Conjugal transfer protein TraX n=1 Tax=Candidatus Butyricicoccus avistercoris TaxID=2838518 RepID=A0A9D1PJ63_9FIRM|nr:conjugal transfer protein TraX [Candidatus Butyricicoccus avistercoris]